MKFLVILALVAFVAARPDGKAKSQVYERYADFDTKPIRENPRLMDAYTKCWLGESTKCTKEAKDIGGVIPEAIQSNCGECSEKQKTEVARVMKKIQVDLPEVWEKMNKMHNPDGKYTEGFKKFINEYAKE